MHMNLMVPATQIELGEEAGTFQLVDDGDRVLVLHHLGVEGSIVNTETPCVVLLAHQQHQR